MTLTLRLTHTRTATYKREEINLPEYAVLLDGERIGTVRRAMVTREHRTRGYVYVNQRWQSPGWHGNSYTIDYPTRVRAIQSVIEDHWSKVGRTGRDYDWMAAEILAATAVVERG